MDSAPASPAPTPEPLTRADVDDIVACNLIDAAPDIAGEVVDRLTSILVAVTLFATAVVWWFAGHRR